MYELTDWGDPDAGADGESIEEEVARNLADNAWLEQSFPELCNRYQGVEAFHDIARHTVRVACSLRERPSYVDNRILVPTAVSELSRLYPNTVFGLRAWGEDFDERWAVFYKNGKSYKEAPQEATAEGGRRRRRGKAAFIEQGLDRLLECEEMPASLQIHRKGADEALGASAIFADEQLVIATFSPNIEQWPNPSAALGVLYKHGATAEIVEATYPRRKKEYWVSYKISCGRDVAAAAAALRQLILLKYPNADLSDFVAEVIKE
jgi:hypothetical protein